MIESNYSFGIERDEEQLKRNNFDHRKWSNPLEIQSGSRFSFVMCTEVYPQTTECTHYEVLLRVRPR